MSQGPVSYQGYSPTEGIEALHLARSAELDRKSHLETYLASRGYHACADSDDYHSVASPSPPPSPLPQSDEREGFADAQYTHQHIAALVSSNTGQLPKDFRSALMDHTRTGRPLPLSLQTALSDLGFEERYMFVKSNPKFMARKGLDDLGYKMDFSVDSAFHWLNFMSLSTSTWAKFTNLRTLYGTQNLPTPLNEAYERFTFNYVD